MGAKPIFPEYHPSLDRMGKPWSPKLAALRVTPISLDFDIPRIWG
jgi:hypothetical protein